MNDDELEATLRRYKAMDPPASLRDAVLQAVSLARVPLTRLDWALVAAAIVLSTIAALTEPTSQDAAASESQAAWEQSVEELAGTLGGGDDALAYARMAIPPPQLVPPAVEEE